MRKKEKGSVLVLTLVLMVMLLLLAGVLLQLTLVNYMQLTKSSEAEQAFWIAKAGLSEAKYYVIKNWFDPELDPDTNNGYTGIVDICKKLVKGKNFGTDKDGNPTGSYKVGISPINGPGVHELVIASEGTTVSTNDYKRLEEYAEGQKTDGFRTTLILRLRMDIPTDYLFFWNGDSGMNFGGDYIIGPVYANGSFFIAVGENSPSEGGYVVNHAYFIKPDTLKGPTVHCNGTFWVPTPFNGDVRIGEGKVKWGPADWTGIPTNQHYYTHNTENNALSTAFQYNDKIVTNNSFWYPVFDYYQPVPTHATPNITFPVAQLDTKTRNLLQDKFHGAYNIYCPTKDEVFRVFQRYIDDNFYIKDTKSTSIPGTKIAGFYNTAAKRKTPFPFVDHGKEVVGFVEYGRPAGIFPWVLNPMVSHYFSRYNPFTFATTKNLEVGGMPVSNDDYEIISGDGGWYTNPNIIFKPGFNMGINTPVSANKCKFLYATNDNVDYHPEAQISSVNWDISGSSVIMKNSISNDPPLDAEYGWGRIYQTASFMSPGSISATVINQYDYSPKAGNEYGYHRRHWLSKTLNGTPFGTGWSENIMTGLIPVTGPKDEKGLNMDPAQWGTPYVSDTGDDRRWSEWEQRVPPIGFAEYETHSGLIKAGGEAKINLRPMIRNSLYGTNPTGYDHVTHPGAVYWFGVPEMGAVGDPISYAGGLHYQPIPTSFAYLNFFKTDTSGGTNAGKKMLINTSGTGVAWWNDSSWQKADGSIFSDFYGSGVFPADAKFPWELSIQNEGGGNAEIDAGSIQFINCDPQTLDVTDVCVTYTSRRKEIISVSGSINNPYKTICTDQWVDLVCLDLSMLDSNNWPKNGLIFSEVPIFVTGIPKKKITIVSTKDVYLGSINYSYWNNNNVWVNCPYTMGDERANPVAVISAGQVYISFQQNTDRSLHPPSELTAKQGTNSQFAVRNLNKVIFYSQTDNLYYCDGTNANRSFIYGSAVLGRKTGLNDGKKDITKKNDTFHTLNVLDSDITRAPISRFANFGMGGSSGLLGTNSSRAYEESFRYNLPACIPKTVKSMDYQEGKIKEVEAMQKSLEELLNTVVEDSPVVRRKGLSVITDEDWESIANTLLITY